MKTSVTQQGREARVKLEGDLRGDLTGVFTQLCATLRGDKVVFDMSGIGQINSPGVAQWVAFLDSLQVPYEFHSCPVLFVDYANLLGKVVGKGRIVSFAAPHRCKPCGRSFTSQVEAAAAAKTHSVPTAQCPSCGRDTKCEIDPADYLLFLGK